MRPVPLYAAATAITAPAVIAAFASRLSRWVMLQNTARSAVRSRGALAEPREDVHADREHDEERDTEADETQTDGLRGATGISRPPHREHEANDRGRRERNHEPTGDLGSRHEPVGGHVLQQAHRNFQVPRPVSLRRGWG